MVVQLKNAKNDVILVSNYDDTEHLEIFIDPVGKAYVYG